MPDTHKLIARLTLGLVCAGLCAWGVVWHYRSEAEQKRNVERQRDNALAMIMALRKKTGQSVVRMVSEHNAVTDWTDTFSGKRFVESLPSDEIARALMRKDGRPVLMFGSIVAVMTENQGCKLELDAKANLVSNIRFLLACMPAQVKEALSHRQEAYEEALEEIRRDQGDPESETLEQRRDNDREAEQEARRGYAFIVHVGAARLGEGETIDDPSYRARFTFAEGSCLDLVYVGRDYLPLDDDETYLRLNTPEDEAGARRMMKPLVLMRKQAHEVK